MTSGTEMIDDQAKQAAPDAAMLITRKKGKNYYFTRGVFPETVADD